MTEAGLGSPVHLTYPAQHLLGGPQDGARERVRGKAESQGKGLFRQRLPQIPSILTVLPNFVIMPHSNHANTLSAPHGHVLLTYCPLCTPSPLPGMSFPSLPVPGLTTTDSARFNSNATNT